MTHRIDPQIVTAADIRARDAAGRFVAKPEPSMIPEMSAALAQALLDADAEAWRIGQAIRYHERLVSTIEFADRVVRRFAS